MRRYSHYSQSDPSWCVQPVKRATYEHTIVLRERKRAPGSFCRVPQNVAEAFKILAEYDGPRSVWVRGSGNMSASTGWRLFKEVEHGGAFKAWLVGPDNAR